MTRNGTYVHTLTFFLRLFQIPHHVQQGMNRMVSETASCEGGLTLNICMSYGSRGEIVNASTKLARQVEIGALKPSDISEQLFSEQLLTYHCGDPDILIRTSGEVRISNFLLWQLAYTEMFFIDKPWPAVVKEDLLEVIRAFAKGRQRRFGK
jgi:undecaprenyl diphosphate synthase